MAQDVPKDPPLSGILPTPPTPGGIAQTGIPWPVGTRAPVPQNLAPGYHRAIPIDSEKPKDYFSKLITLSKERQSEEDDTKTSTKERDFIFSSPAFLDFKFNKEPILACLC